MSLPEKYFYSKGKDTLGPFEAEKISQLIHAGEIGKNDWMYTASKDWFIATGFKEFEKDFNKSEKTALSTKAKSAGKKAAKSSILKLPWINENPFRLLDLPVTASKREIERSLTKAKAFAKVGKPLSPKSDYGLPFDPQTTLEFLEQAKSDIDQPERRIRSSVFWFWEGSAIDKMAFDAIEKKNENRASEIWDKVCKGKAVSKSNFSSARNLSLYRLANAGNEGTLSEQSLKDNLDLAGKFFSSEYLESYLDTLPVERKKNVESHYHAKDFANHVVDSLSEFLGRSNITLKKFIDYFEEFPEVAVDSVKSKFTKKEIVQVESEVEMAKRISSEEPAEAMKSARNLLKKSRSNLKLLSEILGEDDLKFKSLCNSVAWELRQSSMIYFNYAAEASPPFDPGSECLSLINEAFKLYSEGRTGKELRDDQEFLEDWVRSKDQRERNNRAVELAESIKSSIEKAERVLSLNAAETMVRTCIPKIEETKKLLSDKKLIQKVSDWVASVATGICVKCCNESSQSASVFRKAVKVMETIGHLETSHQVQLHYDMNLRILRANLSAANQAEGNTNSSSGCYIATMVYGSCDSPEVIILRDFRDKKLSKHPLGKFFIKAYYRFSPTFVSITKDIHFVQSPIRFILNKLVKCIAEK